jgi:hypothetical protein
MKRSPLRRVSLQTKTSTKVARKARRKRRATKAKLDQMARAYVMERDKYACQLKGLGTIPDPAAPMPKPDSDDRRRRIVLPCSSTLQWMHVKSRRYLSTRWLPANSIAGCAAHHRWAHDNPDEFIGWWSTTYPDRAVEVKHVFNNHQGWAPTTLEIEEMLR